MGDTVRTGIVARNRDGYGRRGYCRLTVNFDGKISVAKKLVGLDRETDGNVGATVENLKDVIANQTSEFAPESLLGNQLDTSITGIAIGTNEVGLSHVR